MFPKIFRGKRDAADFSDEIQTHIELEIERLREQGLSEEAAQAAACRQFGSPRRARETFYESSRWMWCDHLAQDVRYGVRTLRKSPGFTFVAILTLALGIGANTAIFSAVNGILFDKLPYRDSSRLFFLEREQIGWSFTRSELDTIREQCCPGLERLSALQGSSARVRGASLAADRDVVYVAPDYFPLLGVKPLLGRSILAEDTQPGNDRVAVLSYRLWLDLFGRDAGIVGHTIIVGEDSYRVIGVMPKDFDLGWNGMEIESFNGLWAPMSPASPNVEVRQGCANAMIARLRNGVTVHELNVQLQTISSRLADARPTQKVLGGLDIVAFPIKHRVFPQVMRPLLILFTAVGFVLLLACVNLSALLLARGWTRQHELAIRRTLGASRFRIARQLFVESCLLAATGGAIGLLFSTWGIRAIPLIAPPGTPRLDHVVLDGRVLFFTLGISLLAAILFGLAPALQAASRRIGESLTGSSGSSFAPVAGRHRHGLRTALIICEVAVALILATGGALMGRSLYKLMNLDTGTRPDRVITMSIQLSESACKQDKDTDCALTVRSILDGARALAGVQDVATFGAFSLFYKGATVEGFRYPGEPVGLGLYVEGETGNRISRGGIGARAISSGFFSALGMRLLRGRDFELSDLKPNPVTPPVPKPEPAKNNGKNATTAEDKAAKEYGCGHEGDPPVAIVSESFAREYIPGDAIGKHFTTCEDKAGSAAWTEIIGVVNDVRDHSLQQFAPGLAYYVPFSSGNSWALVARTSADPMVIVPGLERVVQSVNKGASITKIETVDQIVAKSASEPRFDAVLFGSLGALGLIIAVIGIYGAISYATAQRTHEIGVRVALGATRRDVVRMILGQGATLAIVGVGFGLAGALCLTRFLRTMLFEITPTDPATLIGVALLLLVVALAACYIPARRAMRVDPMVALRYE